LINQPTQLSFTRQVNRHTIHKIARLFYKLWTEGGTYTDPGENYYEQKYRERLVKRLKKTAQSLGFEVVPQSSTESVS
jgi:hypothetical protein